jgi:hypothetical protein
MISATKFSAAETKPLALLADVVVGTTGEWVDKEERLKRKAAMVGAA